MKIRLLKLGDLRQGLWLGEELRLFLFNNIIIYCILGNVHPVLFWPLLPEMGEFRQGNFFFLLYLNITESCLGAR